MNKKNELLIENITSENTFISCQIDKIISSKQVINIKDMADMHRYSETRLFNLQALSILNGSEKDGR